MSDPFHSKTEKAIRTLGRKQTTRLFRPSKSLKGTPRRAHLNLLVNRIPDNYC